MADVRTSEKTGRARIREPKQKRSMETRQKLMDSATELFGELGFDATTTNHIAQHAGVSIGSFYAHFADKWELFLKILEQYSETVYLHTKSVIDRILEEGQELSQVIDWVVDDLYEAHATSGKLNMEMIRFAAMNENASAIRNKWQRKEDKEMQKILERFLPDNAHGDTRSAALIIHLMFNSFFEFLYRHNDEYEEKQLVVTFKEVLRRMAGAPPESGH